MSTYFELLLGYKATWHGLPFRYLDMWEFESTLSFLQHLACSRKHHRGTNVELNALLSVLNNGLDRRGEEHLLRFLVVTWLVQMFRRDRCQVESSLGILLLKCFNLTLGDHTYRFASTPQALEWAQELVVLLLKFLEVCLDLSDPLNFQPIFLPIYFVFVHAFKV